MAGLSTPALGTVTTSIAANSAINVNQWGGTATTLGQKTMASAVPVAVASDQSSIPVSGTFWQTTQPVSIASAVTVAQATAANLNATVIGTGTFAVQAAQSGTWNITNISGTVSLPTGASTETTLAKLPIAQSAALGTNAGPMIQGSVTTSAPTYTTGNINPLSLTTAGALRVDGSGVTQPVSGTFWQTTQPISAASLPLPTGASTAAKQPALGTAGTASADVLTVQGIAGMTKLLVTPDSVALPANQSVNVAQINGVTPLMGNGVTGTGSQRVTIASDNTVLPAVGAGATGSAVPANASYVGVDASTALPTAATAGNLTGAMGDKYGRQVVLPVAMRDLIGTQTTTITASTVETTIVTAALSIFNDLLLLVCSNTSATAARLDFRDTTAGTILFSLYLPAGDTRGFSMGGVAIPQTTVNTNWTAQSSASVTDLRIYAVWVKNR